MTIRLKILAAAVFFLITGSVMAQTLATFKVTVPGDGTLDVAVSTSLDAITTVTALKAARLSLNKISNGKSIPVPFQIEYRKNYTIWWSVNASGKEETYELVKKSAKHDDGIVVNKRDGSIVISSGAKDLLAYRYEIMPVPEGVKPAYARGGFIHPLWSPQGQVLTRIQPKDHYHHYGIWNPWTHTLYKGDTVDFWNIGSGKATVRHAGIGYTFNGPIYGGYSVYHDHVVLKNPEDIAMKEHQLVRVIKPGADHYIVDITSHLDCGGSDPITLLKYRYGGLGWRTTEQWDNKNSEVITSDGRSRKDADGSKAKWCIIQGQVDGVVAGVVMMSHPENYNHPEPLRIWPENQYDRGDMFANFSPTKDKDLVLEPGKGQVLNYRLLVFNNTMTKERAEQAWQHYAYPPIVHVTLHSK